MQTAVCLETNPQINTMLQIIEATNLSIAQGFISLLFGDRDRQRSKPPRQHR